MHHIYVSGPGPTHNSGKLANHRMPKDANLQHQEQQEHGSSLESTKIRDLEAELARLKTLELENLRAIAMQRLQASEASIPAIFPYEGKWSFHGKKPIMIMRGRERALAVLSIPPEV